MYISLRKLYIFSFLLTVEGRFDPPEEPPIELFTGIFHSQPTSRKVRFFLTRISMVNFR